MVLASDRQTNTQTDRQTDSFAELGCAELSWGHPKALGLHELTLASFADLEWPELGWGHPQVPLVTNGIEIDDLRDGLREGNARIGLG